MSSDDSDVSRRSTSTRLRRHMTLLRVRSNSDELTICAVEQIRQWSCWPQMLDLIREHATDADYQMVDQEVDQKLEEDQKPCTSGGCGEASPHSSEYDSEEQRRERGRQAVKKHRNKIKARLYELEEDSITIRRKNEEKKERKSALTLQIANLIESLSGCRNLSNEEVLELEKIIGSMPTQASSGART